MFLMEALFAFVMALVFTAIFVPGFQRQSPRSTGLVFFLIVFLAAWAGSLWISPAGPVFLGIFWVPIIAVAFIFAILLSAILPRRPSTRHVKTISQVKQEERVKERLLGAFFWTLLAGLIVVIIWGYTLRQAPA